MKNFDFQNFDFATIQLTKAGSKLATKILRSVLAKALSFIFHGNANGPFMQKEKIIAWHVFRFPETQACFNYITKCLSSYEQVCLMRLRFERYF